MKIHLVVSRYSFNIHPCSTRVYLALFTVFLVVYQWKDNFSSKQAPQCHTEDCASNELQTRRGIVGR